jgi:nucleotide-binding universal stress UspA family protein
MASAASSMKRRSGAGYRQALTDYVTAHDVGLLVMGGFGHARAREFILGGATRRMLEAPPCPILMSH